MWKKEEIPEVLFLAYLPRGSRAIKNSMMKRKNSLGTARRQYRKLIHQLSLGRTARKQETLLASQNKIIPLMITVTKHRKLLQMMGVKFPVLCTHFEWNLFSSQTQSKKGNLGSVQFIQPFKLDFPRNPPHRTSSLTLKMLSWTSPAVLSILAHSSA